MTVLILAGGFATRLWPLTERRSKALLPIAGKPIISYLLEKIDASVPVIVSTNGVFAGDFEEWRKGFSDRDVRVFLEDSKSDEQKKGAVGAISMAISDLGIRDDLMVLAGDNFFGFDFLDFLSKYDGKTPLLAVRKVMSLDEARQFGVAVTEGERLIGFEEKPEHPKSMLVSTACYVFPESTFGLIHECARVKADHLGGLMEFFLDRKEDIKVFEFEEEWVDIGSFESYLQTHKSLQKETIVSPTATLVRSKLIGDCNVVGDGCVIEDSVLENAIVMKGCTVKNCVLRDTIVDEGSVLSGVDLERKMVRRGSRLIMT